MKKNIGSKLALYPTPLVVVGAMVNGKPNWTLVGHLGIIGHDRVMVSMSDTHYSNQGIRDTKALSINIVDEAMLQKADYTGCVSGTEEDKSELFAYHIAEGGAPMIDVSPVSMVCTVEDTKAAAFKPYLVRVTIPDLNIRKGPGTDYGKTGKYTGIGTFTIVGEADGRGASRWGKLRSNAGWVSLDYAQKV